VAGAQAEEAEAEAVLIEDTEEDAASCADGYQNIYAMLRYLIIRRFLVLVYLVCWWRVFRAIRAFDELVTHTKEKTGRGHNTGPRIHGDRLSSSSAVVVSLVLCCVQCISTCLSSTHQAQPPKEEIKLEAA
jgi:uncharacterized membrane protein YqjE